MLIRSATLIGAVGVAFLAGSLAPGLVEGGLFVRSSQALSAAHASSGLSVREHEESGKLLKRLPENSDGMLLFQPESLTTTYFQRDVAPAAASRRGHLREPAIEKAPVREQSQEETRKKRRSLTYGCMASVSPLVKTSEDLNPSLCLT